MGNNNKDNIDLTIVLATLNEIENLPILVNRLSNVLQNIKTSYQLLFVDDNSTDGTKEFIIDYCSKNPPSKYIFNKTKRSTLIARSQGIQKSNGKYIIIMDADLQHPPEYVANIYNALLKGYDIVIASRYIKGGSTGKREPERGIISRGASTLAKIFLKSSRYITDPVSCFLGFKNNLNLEIDNGWKGYEIGIFLRASNTKAKVKEIPYVFANREKGKSKVTSSFNFIRIYLIELLHAKKVERKSYALSRAKKNNNA